MYYTSSTYKGYDQVYHKDHNVLICDRIAWYVHFPYNRRRAAYILMLQNGQIYYEMNKMGGCGNSLAYVPKIGHLD